MTSPAIDPASPTDPDSPTPQRESLTARSPDDLVAAVPVVLGFEPEDSVVMLTQGAEHEFHARVDLPGDLRARRVCADTLLAPALRHRVWGVVFVLYTNDPVGAKQCAKTLRRTFERGGIEVLEVLRSDGRRWFAMSDDGRPEGPGHAYDLSRHEFTARAVAAGRVMLASRSELAASVAPDHEATRAVTRALETTAEPAPAEREWVLSTMTGLVAEHARPDAATTARLLRGLRVPEVRDAVLRTLDRRAAERTLPLLSALTRSAPTDLVAPVASTLAFAAWLAGDGALAWCAIERAETGTEPCSLAGRVGRALELAMPPAVWRGA